MHQDTVTWETDIKVLVPRSLELKLYMHIPQKRIVLWILEKNEHAHSITFPARITFCVETFSPHTCPGSPPRPSPSSHSLDTRLSSLSKHVLLPKRTPKHFYALLFSIYHGMNAAHQQSSKESFKVESESAAGLHHHSHLPPNSPPGFPSYHEYHSQHPYQCTFVSISGSLLR